MPKLKAPFGASYPRKFRPNFSLSANSDSSFFSVLPHHVLWLVQETRAILSTNQKTNLEPSAPGHSYFPAPQAVCLCWLWSLTGWLATCDISLSPHCSDFTTNATQDHFRLSVEKCSIPRARILSISCHS